MEPFISANFQHVRSFGETFARNFSRSLVFRVHTKSRRTFHFGTISEGRCFRRLLFRPRRRESAVWETSKELRTRGSNLKNERVIWAIRFEWAYVVFGNFSMGVFKGFEALEEGS